MANFDINSLNEEQILALKETQGAVLVTAGAGSGKTRLLTHRVAYLMENMHISPYNILAITFTNKASAEMKERISQMVDGAHGVWISTFHSMCAQILRREVEIMPSYTKNFSIYSESDSDKAIKDILEAHNIADDKFKKSVSYHISNWKNGDLSLEGYITLHKDEQDIRKIAGVIVEYENTLRKNNAFDFDDLIRKTTELFINFPQVLDKYACRFEYVLVDEFQDTNTVQYNLVKMLASVHGNVFAVGDEDQCIYSWRGANFENIFNIKKDFPDCKVFKLERNYRSTSNILNIANNVIKNNKARLDKKMWTEKGEGEVPTLYNAYDERDEALYVAKNIERLRNEGFQCSEMAVLMRLNALSRSFEEAFLSYNIPHRIFGGFKFFERQEIRNIISYLRLFVNIQDDISLLRIINFPKRAIGDMAINKIKVLAQDAPLLETILSAQMLNESAIYKKLSEFINGYKFLANMPQKPISHFVEKVIETFKIREAYLSKTEEDTNRLLNIESLLASVKEFETANPDSDLSNYLESVTLISDNDEIGQGGAVTIATVHAVKGLEFKCVFVIGLEESIFPISRASSNADIEEERRLMYVALTRAEEKLFMSHCSKRYMYGQSQYQAPSRYIRELGLLSVNNQASNKTDKTFSSVKQYSSPKTSVGGFNKDAFMQKLNQMENNVRESKPKMDVSVYKVGQSVEHPKFGVGAVVSISDDGLVGDIVFEDFGKKSLMLDLAPLTIIND